MDGYAIAQSSELSADSTIEIIGESQAGSAYTDPLVAGQGEEIEAGEAVLIVGKRINPTDISLLAGAKDI